MPEGDTVWLVAERLNTRLRGSILGETDFRVPALATVDLAGSRVTQVRSYGKHLLIATEGATTGAQTLHSHLKMEGAWHLYPPGARWRGGPSHQIRAVLRTADTVAVGYRLAGLEIAPTSQARQRFLAHLGPDILDPEFDPDVAWRRVAAETDRGIAEVLLDQRVLAGLGMNYVAEVCFLSGVHPKATVDTVDSQAIVSLASRMILANRGRAARTTTGSSRRGSSSWIHGRRTCLRCDTRLEFDVIGAPAASRRIPWCPTCQRDFRDRE
ncbi:MAG: hypothetical protein KDC23_04765 [Actinobacteria bacterium]|nr:hypothetical protein [Actinomycetota bacterium]